MNGVLPVNDIVMEFKGDYSFLSNFYPCQIRVGSDVYSTLEHAYQASKTILPEEKELIKRAPTPGKAKKLGRNLTIRPDWDNIKCEIMYSLLKEKFSDDKLKKMLLKTEAKELVEGNWWGDDYWGFSFKTKKGKNMLGKLLMQVREELKLKKKSKSEETSKAFN